MGVLILVLSLESYPIVHRPLEMGASQCIGELSFGIYALHPLLLFSFYKAQWEPMRERYRNFNSCTPFRSACHDVLGSCMCGLFRRIGQESCPIREVVTRQDFTKVGELKSDSRSTFYTQQPSLKG